MFLLCLFFHSLSFFLSLCFSLFAFSSSTLSLLIFSLHFFPPFIHSFTRCIFLFFFDISFSNYFLILRLHSFIHCFFSSSFLPSTTVSILLFSFLHYRLSFSLVLYFQSSVAQFCQYHPILSHLSFSPSCFQPQNIPLNYVQNGH